MAETTSTSHQIMGNRNIQASDGGAVIVDPPPRTPEQRYRQSMLNKVQRIWIDGEHGVLKHSLSNEVLITLGLSTQPTARMETYHAEAQQVGDQIPEPLPPNTRILDVYDSSREALLILGAPGAGKTTLLLELTQHLLQRAREDEAHPIPVVFPLSSWVASSRPLEEWLVDELNKRYDVVHHIAYWWVDTDQILPLLDGLDEVAEDRREDCVAAITAYRGTHGLLPLVVTCRRDEYDLLPGKLPLEGAVVVQSLTREQVRHYLRDVGLNVAPSSQSPLWDVLDTPLMLHIASLTYAGHDGPLLPSSATADEHREHVFATYVDQMFKGKGVPTWYTEKQARHWLAWLAWQFQRQNQPTVYLEHLQPDWLPDRKARWQFTLLDRLGGGLVCGQLGGLVIALASMGFGQIFGLVVGLLFGLFGGNHDALALRSRDINHVMYDAFRGWFIFELVLGLPLLLLVELTALPSPYLEGGLAIALIAGLPGALLGGLLGTPGVHPRHIDVIEALRWSWSNAWHNARTGLGFGLAFGPVFVLLFVLDTGRVYGLDVVLFGGLVLGLLFGLVGGLLFGLVGGVTSREIPQETRPTQGLRRSAQYALFIGLVLGPILGLACGVIGGPVLGLAYGMIGGLGLALAFGGYACLSHVALRLILWHGGAMPLRYVRFLDESVSRTLLRRVGGGYSFGHRLLLDWFAKQYNHPETHSGPAADADHTARRY